MSGHHHHASIAATPRRQAAEAAIAFDGEAGAALHRRRRRLGLTATEVGRRVGITQRQMARLELGLEPLTLRLALGLGAVLGMPPGWFLGLETATVPEAIGVDVAASHGRWAEGLALRLTDETGTQH